MTLFLDIETIPDESRIEHWGLPKLQELPVPSYLLSGTVTALQNWLKEYATVLHSAYIDELEAAETTGKNRASALDAITAARSAGNDLITQMSVDPDTLKIIAIGYAINREAVVTMTLADMTEKEMLQVIWTAMEVNAPYVGYNLLRFDLRAIAVRSMLLGVKPGVNLDWRRYGNRQIIDLMELLYPFGKWKGLKKVAPLFGVTVPVEDVEGSQVIGLYRAGEWDTLKTYLASDISVTRDLYYKGKGYLW